MSNTLPIRPSYTLSYWKPWKENSNAFDSWTDFVKDLSLAEYTANTICQYINEATTEQASYFKILRNEFDNGIEDIVESLNSIVFLVIKSCN
jgi:hypothetical protein